ncbi:MULTISPECIES: fumarylacetoacetate hydrolase family protein [Rhizobium/Agrobacterium group]|uniref:Fumarylacetoacetate hydrolase family protein n=2 Tax=Neorhizobium TaxID=1525371 RepID=A0ABV0LYX1_9HYPH|nr:MULTISPECIES: fumarylacetoacetate hydrolase family protein [Rhizobium/Agrobacterium group]MCC2612275.1 fumarylacetoacetate hydrolase family protein [Neorhizobium petrolearium]WGI67418.1 fumarylacetoacetate hydrolase family protein [Neorhizobium petrolearium]
MEWRLGIDQVKEDHRVNIERALAPESILPLDAADALLVGRAWSKALGGPCPVLLSSGHLFDLSPVALTMSGLLEIEDLASKLKDTSRFAELGSLASFLDGTAGELLAPADLQAVKAAGVTFADSMLERVIEEQAKGDPLRAQDIRSRLAPVLGDNLKGLVAGSEKAASVKALLQEMGLWSQYLEVGIGPDAEIFTKAQPMSSVGCGALIGIHPKSDWNNPEPEVVLAVTSKGKIVGATLGNDVNLRDFEGRSALLLSKAKDNNASCAVGPFVRLFDGNFTIDDIKSAEISLAVEGTDGFIMTGISPMQAISRSPENLVSQLLNRNHQYPDGVLFFLGTMFAPVKDRRGKGLGFTHEIGDRVEISTPKLGRLVNWVEHSDNCPEWNFGLTALMKNLAGRGLL